MNPKLRDLTLVIHGTLEDLLAEAKEARRPGNRVHVRAAVLHRTRRSTLGDETTTILLIVTSLIVEDILLTYGQWIGEVGMYAEMHSRPLSEWTKEDGNRLAELIVESTKQLILQETGIEPGRGQYATSQEWLTATGITRLLDFQLFRAIVKPPEHRQVQALRASVHDLVLGTYESGVFQVLPDERARLTSDERVRLVSPDLINQWLMYPTGYELAIAEREETHEGPIYHVLYDPEGGWRLRLGQ